MSNLLKFIAIFSLILGVLLSSVSLFGLGQSLRAPQITEDYADFARPSTPSYTESMKQLDALGKYTPRSLEFITEATRIFHYGIAHIPPGDIKKNGLDFYRMRVPVWENYILHALSYVAPDAFMDYEFCSYRKSLERATGRCGQQSMALADFLDEQGVETGYVGLGGHALAMAKTDAQNWVILDPDFGGVIPFDLQTAERDPESVIPHYWNKEPVLSRGLYKLFSPERNRVSYGKPESRQPTTCLMEQVAYVAKWIIPFALLGLGWLAWSLAARVEKKA